MEVSKGWVVGITVIAILLFFIFTTVGWVVGFYNKMVVARQDIDTQFSNIKTEYQRRADLFVNLVEVAKGYASFEQDTLVEVTKMRNVNFAGLQGTKEEQMAQLNNIEGTLSRLLAVFEKYPELKTVELYIKLHDQIRSTEDRIQIARSDYNGIVRSYNIQRQRFPNILLANIMGFAQEKYFENLPGTEQAPIINATI